MLLVCGLLFVVTAPALSIYQQFCESRNALLHTPDASGFDGYADRLQRSANREERNSLFMGYHTELEFPILLSSDLLREHMHVLGATGGGKSALGMTPLITQLIRRDDGPVIVLDCKGDNSMFNTAKIEAERAGKTFKWFTNKPNRSTYIFNPFLQSSIGALTMQEVVGLFMLSLNLHHGDDYGRAWFSMASRRLFQAALNEFRKGRDSKRPLSFAELEEVLSYLSNNHEEFKAAQHLAFVIQGLSEFEQLNLSPNNNHPAVEHAIHMPEVIDKKQVVYFSLVAATDLTSVAEIARLAMYCALNAAMDYRERTGRRPNVYLVVDEAQNVVAKNIENVLAQAREHGLACILCHQTMSQLNPPGGVDLRELVQNCTCIKLIFSTRDPHTKQYLSDISGEVGYYDATWTQFVPRVRQGNVGKHVAVYYGDELPLCQVRQEIGPRLTAEDINDLSRHPNRCAISIERNEGYSINLGAFPVHMDWVMPKSEYERRNNDIPWPAGGDATISIEPLWPQPNEETIVTEFHPLPDAREQPLDKLIELRKLLEGED